MARSVYENSMVAHIWANESQESARSHNGQFYFEGPRIYSYGSHYLAGLLVRDKAGKRYAFVNGEGRSITTSRHLSYVWRALNYSQGTTIPDLTDFDRDCREADYRATPAEKAKAIRAAIVKQYTLGLYGEGLACVCAAFGLERSLNAIQREGAAIVAAKAKQEKAKQAARSLHLAKQYAAMSEREFRETLASYADSYSVDRLARFATDLFRFHRDTKAKLGKRDAATLSARIKQARAAKADWNRIRERKQARDNAKRAVQAIRQANTAIESLHSDLRPAYYAGLDMWQLRRLSDSLVTVAPRLRGEGKALARERAAMCDSLVAEAERKAAAERFAREQAARESWLRGEGSLSYARFSDERGGALCRIIGDELQTSHGARVPLTHAVKVFQFVKLCREQGRNWQRNGKTIRVGHFQVDSISAAGDFVAGCHKFHWPEIERVARIAGVFDSAATEAALESTY